MARVFISGGGGFIGRNLIPSLLDRNHSVVTVRRDSAIIPNEHTHLSVIRGDLRAEIAGLAESLGECDTLIHLAGDTTPTTSASNFDAELDANLKPLLRVLEAAQKSRVRRIVLLSSGGTVYGKPRYTPIDEDHPTLPTTPYGLGKLAAEHIARLWAVEHGTEYLLLRAANPYGPYQFGRNNQGVIGVWLQRVLKGQPLVVWGDGRAVRDFLYVGDLTEALWVACEVTRIESGIYNVGSGVGHDLLEIADVIGRVTGLAPRLEFAAAQSFGVAVNILNSKRFQAAFGWRPRTALDDGVKLTYEFLMRK